MQEIIAFLNNVHQYDVYHNKNLVLLLLAAHLKITLEETRMRLLDNAISLKDLEPLLFDSFHSHVHIETIEGEKEAKDDEYI